MSAIISILTLMVNNGDSKTQSRSVYYDSSGDVSEFKPIDPFFTFGIVESNGYYYIGAMRTAGSPNNRMPRILKYNPTTNTIIQTLDIDTYSGVTSAFDVHPIPTMNVDSSGNIYLFREKSGDSTGWSDNHKTNIMIHKTSTPGDLSTMTLIKEITAVHSYVYSIINGTNLRVFGRGNSLAKLGYYASTDLGVNFGVLRIVYDSGNIARRAYNQHLKSFDGNYYVIINERYDTTSTWTFVALIKTTDFITWSNVQGTFSKDVINTSAITRTELVANCMIHQSTDEATDTIQFEGGIVDSSGNVKVLISGGTPIDPVVAGNKAIKHDLFKLYYYDSGWQSNDITSLINNWEYYWAYTRYFYFYHSDTFDCIYLVDEPNDKALYRYKSDDNFATYTSEKLVNGSSDYWLGGICPNVTDIDNHLVVIVDIQGTYLDTNDSSNLLIVKP